MRFPCSRPAFRANPFVARQAGLPEAILDHRTNWGPFLSLADLTSALGLDRQAAAALHPFLRVVVPR